MLFIKNIYLYSCVYESGGKNVSERNQTHHPVVVVVRQSGTSRWSTYNGYNTLERETCGEDFLVHRYSSTCEAAPNDFLLLFCSYSWEAMIKSHIRIFYCAWPVCARKPNGDKPIEPKRETIDFLATLADRRRDWGCGFYSHDFIAIRVLNFSQFTIAKCVAEINACLLVNRDRHRES